MSLAKHENLLIDQIELDQTNPRIQLALETFGSKITADRIALALAEGSDDRQGAGNTFNRLRNSIRKHKGIVNPIVVNIVDGKYICVEGNTRVQIYRDFIKGKVEGVWDKIPALVYQSADRETTEAIRLQAHVIGPRQWTPYAKARYLTKLYDEELLTYEQIVEYCGGGKKEVERSIAAYRLAEWFRGELDDPADFKQEVFSGFVEFQDKKIQIALMDAHYENIDFCNWLHDGKFNRLEHVRSLHKILKDEEAKKVFLKKGSRAALNYLEQPGLEKILADADLITLLQAVEAKISRMTYEELQKLKGEPQEMINAIVETRADLKGLLDEIRGEE